MKSIAQEIDSSNQIYPIIRSYLNELNEKHDAFLSTELSSTTITIKEKFCMNECLQNFKFEHCKFLEDIAKAEDYILLIIMR
jgi:hypothetical protein